MQPAIDYSLYLVTDRANYSSEDKFLKQVEQCIEGGVRVVQLREKHLDTLPFIQLGEKLLSITRKHKIPLLINDRVDVCLAIDADGVHVGQGDMPITIARKLLGSHKIIGVTVNSKETAKEAFEQGANYLGTDAIFATPTKVDSKPIGIEKLKEIVDSVPIPVVAIGGINESTATQVLSYAHPTGIAVVSVLMSSNTPKETAEKLRQLVTNSSLGRSIELPIREDIISTLKKKAAHGLSLIKSKRPLIHHITNYVVMNDTANVTLHIGALPVMSHAIEEVGEMVNQASCLVLNPGTLSKEWIHSMIEAGQQASRKGVPIILDPVGAGATQFRTETNLKLLDTLPIKILRGNSGEIAALAGVSSNVVGVESVEDPKLNVKHIVQQLSTNRKTVVAASGVRDIISDGKTTVGVDNGNKWLTTITGTGCDATTVIATFLSVMSDDPFAAAVAGYGFIGIAADLAMKSSVEGPATFKIKLFDQMFCITPEDLIANLKIVEL